MFPALHFFLCLSNIVFPVNQENLRHGQKGNYAFVSYEKRLTFSCRYEVNEQNEGSYLIHYIGTHNNNDEETYRFLSDLTLTKQMTLKEYKGVLDEKKIQNNNVGRFRECHIYENSEGNYIINISNNDSKKTESHVVGSDRIIIYWDLASLVALAASVTPDMVGEFFTVVFIAQNRVNIDKFELYGTSKKIIAILNNKYDCDEYTFRGRKNLFPSYACILRLYVRNGELIAFAKGGYHTRYGEKTFSYLCIAEDFSANIEYHFSKEEVK